MTNAMPKNKPAQQPPNIPFIDLAAQRARIADKIDAAVLNAVHDGKYIMGPQVKELEEKLAKFCGAKYCVSCSSGTDSLALILMAKNVGAGDAVFVPSFTFVATAEVIAWVGATPFFVDVLEDSFNMDPKSLDKAITEAKQQGLKPTGIMPVDLFGQPADYRQITAIAEENDLWVLADAAQGFGAKLDDKPVGTHGLATSTSFFPAKPLGCYGDGGAVFTDDAELADIMRSLRVHGKGSNKYDNVRIGMNARLDTLQAAILLEKLDIFADELEARHKVAMRYNDALREVAQVPDLINGATSAWAQYTLVLPEGANRDEISAYCKKAGVPTAVYYPIPLSQQEGYKHFPVVSTGTPVADALSSNVLSLPMHPYLELETQDYIIETVKNALAL